MDKCEFCRKRPAQMTLMTASTAGTDGAPACLQCFHSESRKAKGLPPVATPPPRRVAPAPTDRQVYKTPQAAGERAEKVYFYLRQRPGIEGDGERGYWLVFDSPLVPGYQGANPYKR